MSSDSNKEQFHFAVDSRTDIVWGEVPFYSPRSPGNIVFRLYFENEPIQTLATGPVVIVDVQEEHLQPTLRFVLSNFKSKLGSGLSSMYSLALMFQNFRPPTPSNGSLRLSVLEGAGRAAWGCICESRKILNTTEDDYQLKKTKLLETEEELLHMKNDYLHNLETLIEKDHSIDTQEENQETEKLSTKKEKDLGYKELLINGEKWIDVI